MNGDSGKSAGGSKSATAKYIAQAAMVAAAYAALAVALAPISFREQQFRVSEALTVLPALMPSAVPGLFVGCVISNLMSPMGLPDLVFGSLATLAAAALTRRIALSSAGSGAGASADAVTGAAPGSALGAAPILRALLAASPPVAVNTLVVGAMLALFAGVPFGAAALGVFAGQAVSCYGLGVPLYLVVSRLVPRRLLV